MKINIIKLIVAIIVFSTIISLLLSACSLILENKVSIDISPIPGDDYIEEYTDSLDNYQAHRRKVYQQQIISEKQELNHNITSLKQQIKQQENFSLQKELAQLLKQKMLVERHISALIKADSTNWESTGFIADKELANLHQKYNVLKKAVRRSQKSEFDLLLPIYKNPKLEVERV